MAKSFIDFMNDSCLIHIMLFSIQSSLDAIVDFVYTIAYGINYLI